MIKVLPNEGGIETRHFLYHFHGLGDLDFSQLEPRLLVELQRQAEVQHIEVVPTIFLRREALGSLINTLTEYESSQQQGLVSNIAGFAVEGPLLGPRGGVPEAGKWIPSLIDWVSIAELGPKGLKYIVMAPDALDLDDEVCAGTTFRDLLTLLYDNGVRVALGHFHHDHPRLSADRTQRVIEFIHDKYVSSPYLVLTDHLYNDMPRNFVHARRGGEAHRDYGDEIQRVVGTDWERADLPKMLGPVPAVLLKAARDDLVMPCLNFDGSHVDLEICRKTFEYLGPTRLIVLTDHTEVGELAGEQLWLDPQSGLWMRGDGVVAAGSGDHETQRANMLSMMTPGDVECLFLLNPSEAIRFQVCRRSSDDE